MKQYIVDIKGICILEDEWEDAKITITRKGIDDTLEFDKSDIVETEEIEDEFYTSESETGNEKQNDNIWESKLQFKYSTNWRYTDKDWDYKSKM